MQLSEGMDLAVPSAFIRLDAPEAVPLREPALALPAGDEVSFKDRVDMLFGRSDRLMDGAGEADAEAEVEAASPSLGPV